MMQEESLKIQNIPSIIWGKQSDEVYLYVHGKMSCKEDARKFAELATNKGYQVISFDLPEHGDRKNENYPCNVWNGINDLTIIGKYVEGRWKKINLYAISLGAYFSLLAFKDFSFKKSLFLSPILDMERLIQNMMKWFSINEETLKKQKQIATPMGETLDWDYYCFAKENPVTKWIPPTAILYGSEDNLTEYEIVERFSEQFNCDLVVLQGSEHYFHKDDQLEFWEQWLKERI